MKPFALALSKSFRHSRIKVLVDSESGEVESNSVLPFGGQAKHASLVWKLLSRGFRKANLTAQQLDWLRKRSWLSDDEQSLVPDFLSKVGRELYQTLFPTGSKVAQLFQREIGRAQGSGEHLILQIALSSEFPQLLAFPWELIYDGRDFVIQRHASISRYIRFDRPPPRLDARLAINVMLLSSRAIDESNHLFPIPTGERNAILRSLAKAKKAGHIRVSRRKASIDSLRHFFRRLDRESFPHIIHFDAHGIFAKKCVARMDGSRLCNTVSWQSDAITCVKCGGMLSPPEGFLLLESNTGDPEYVNGRSIGELLQKATENGLAVVVLSSCQSAVTGGYVTAFNGVAQSLIALGIPAVVAMQQSVTVQAAAAFSEGFYSCLAARKSLPIAVREGRRAIGINTDEWFRPALYLRWRDNEGGQLFVQSDVGQEPILSIESAKERAKQITRAIFEQFQHESGGIASGMSEWVELDRPGEWTTAECILVGLQSSAFEKRVPHLSAICRATLWMLRGDARRCNGGWGDIGYDVSTDTVTNIPCTESTTWMILALTELLKSSDRVALPKVQLKQSLVKAVQFLFTSQSADGGWCTFPNDELGSRTYPSAMAIYSLAKASHMFARESDVNSRVPLVIKKGILWAERQARPNGWSANSKEPGANVASTAHMYSALAWAASLGFESRVLSESIPQRVRGFLDDVVSRPNVIGNHVESLPWRRLGPVRQFEWKWLPWVCSLARLIDHKAALQLCASEITETFLKKIDAQTPWKLALGCFALCAYATVESTQARNNKSDANAPRN